MTLDTSSLLRAFEFSFIPVADDVLKPKPVQRIDTFKQAFTVRQFTLSILVIVSNTYFLKKKKVRVYPHLIFLQTVFVQQQNI